MKKALLTPSYTRGLYLEELDLWMDPSEAKSFAFVSHAHADHFARHETILCSEATAHLVSSRYNVAQGRVLSLPFHQPLDRDGYRLTLLPAGHILGSAMLHITRLEDEATLLYTGDFKVRQGRTAEPIIFKQADTLIMETTFGKPHYVFPPQHEIEASILQFVYSALDDNDTPVLLGYSLGKAQEALAILAAENIPCILHKNVWEMTQASIQTGCDLPDSPMINEEGIPRGHVFIAPPHAVRSKQLRSIKNRRIAMLSGWAMNPGSQFRYRTDAAFPLSDHADHPGLMEAILRVKPKQVLTLHGSAREFAAELRQQSISAWSVFGNDQVEMVMPGAKPIRERKNHDRPVCTFSHFTRLCETVERSSGRLEKIEHVARHFKNSTSDDLPVITQWLTGRPFSRTSQHKALNVGSATLRQALLEVSQITLPYYKDISRQQADAARTARLILEEASLQPQPWNISDVQNVLISLSESSGSLTKISILRETLSTLHPQEASTLVRLLTGDLRIGLKEALVEDALALAYDRAPSDVRRANMLTGDLGHIALLALRNHLDQASLRAHVPLKPMLASPEEDEDGIWNRLGNSSDPVWLEDKYDGIRAQLHWADGKASLFSRDLRSLGTEFPEVLEAAANFSDQVVLDGELIAYAEGKKLTFFDLQKRLGRKKQQGDLFLGAAVPVRFIAFDLLWHNGRNLLDEPLSKRREILESIKLPQNIECITVESADSPDHMNQLFQASRRRGNEGLIAKDPKSPYSPGRRGKTWLKLKKIGATLDCVVIKAQQGHGKRAEVLSDYTFAVRDTQTGALATIGKAYSGLTDTEIETLTDHFMNTTLSKKGRVRDVDPQIVLEIAFDSIQPSKRHNSGLSLRFPRIKAIRHDKGPQEIDTLDYARQLAAVGTL